MALKANIERHGVTIPDAYVRVEPHTLNKDMLGFRAVMFASEDAPEPFAVEDRTCPYDLDGPNPWIQAYDYLKAQPEFAAADDLLTEKAKPALPERRSTGPQAGPVAEQATHSDKAR